MKFYANPYNIGVTGFYFDTFEEYETKSAALKDSFGNPVEEFEIDVIDGTAEECALAKAAKVTQGEIDEFLEFINDSDEGSWPTIFYLMDNLSMEFNQARREADNYSVVESSLKDYAYELADECYLSSLDKETRQWVSQYFDYDRFANDLRVGGDCVEFEFGGKTFTCTNANQ